MVAPCSLRELWAEGEAGRRSLKQEDIVAGSDCPPGSQFQVTVRAWTLGACLPSFRSLCSTHCCRVGSMSGSSLSFLISKMGIIIVPAWK